MIEGVANGGHVYARAFRAGIAPPELAPVSEWAESFRVLSPRASSEPGPWRNARTPYLVEIMDSLGPDCPAERVVFMKGAQVGGTEAGMNWLGAVIDQDPGPVMVVLPTVDLAKRWSKQRLDPMIRDSPTLAAKVHERRSRDAGNTVLFKEFPSGTAALVGANSAAGLRSMPFGKLYVDELDAFPMDVEGEGDPVVLAERGMRTFSRRKGLYVSTPTFRGRSRIEREYQASDQRRYHVPCPFCGHFQTFEWKGLKWDDDDPETVRYECEECEGPIPEASKTEMLELGKWVPAFPERSNVSRGYHLSALYSPVGWRSWEEIVRTFLKGMGKIGDEHGRGVAQEILRPWTNHDLGESWVEKGDAPPWEMLYNRRETYEVGKVPEGVCVMTAGADVQLDRIEVEFVGWGPGLESWSIAYVVLPGDPAQPNVWRELETLAATMWPSVDEKVGAMRARMLAVDAQYATQHVRMWVREQRRPDRVICVRHMESLHLPIGMPRKVDISMAGKTIKRGCLEWPIGVNDLKTELYGFLRADQPTDPGETGYPRGWCHFPEYGHEYFRQLTAERLIPKTNKRGYRVYEWEQTRERNEALDCRNYARAALSAIGGDRWTLEDWEALKASRGGTIEPAEDQARKRGGGLDRMRGRQRQRRRR